MTQTISENRGLYMIVGTGIALIGLIIGLYVFQTNKPGRYDDFARCIKDSGTIFYGAFWCSHCQNQKKLFGSSAKYLPYVECSTPDGRGQTAYCDEKGVNGYPYWVFPDGSKLSGEVTLATLSEKTKCPMYPTTNVVASSTPQ